MIAAIAKRLVAPAVRRPYLVLLAAPMVFLGAFMLYPLAQMFSMSVHPYDPQRVVGTGLTAENYTKLFLDPFYQRVLGRTIRLGAIVSLVSLVLAYPVAYFLSRTRSRAKGWLVFLLLTPLMVGIVVRTYGWIVLLGANGAVNRTLVAIGLVEQPVRILFTDWAVLIGLVEVLLPYMVLPLLSSLQKVDAVLEEAAATLGASPAEVLRRVVLPLSVPGVVSGVVIVFTLAAGAIVTPAILGGPRMQTVGTLIYQVMTNTVNWPFGSALAFALLTVEAVPIFLVFGLTARRERR